MQLLQLQVKSNESVILPQRDGRSAAIGAIKFVVPHVDDDQIRRVRENVGQQVDDSKTVDGRDSNIDHFELILGIGLCEQIAKLRRKRHLTIKGETRRG